MAVQAKIVDIGKTYLYLPPDTSSNSDNPTYFEWYIIPNRDSRNVCFQIQIDKTSDSFGDLELEKFSYKDSGFEYYDGASWLPVPTTGVSSTYVGNLARYGVLLTTGQKYWRVKTFIM